MENIGTEKYWHGMARKKYHNIDFLGEIFLGRKIRDFFIKCKSHHLAILINIWHIWEDRSRKVNMNEPDLRFFTETFDLLWARPFENLVFRPESQGGQISGSPELVGTLPQAPFFSRKIACNDLQCKEADCSRDAPARHGTEDPEIYGTARHGKSWHGKSWHGTARKILARKNHGTARPEKNIIKLFFWGKSFWVFFGENNFGSKNPGLFARIQNPTFSHP